MFGVYPVVVVVSGMGIDGSYDATLSVNDAIEDWNVNVVIAVGVAMGLKKDKQVLGDVLVSSSIQNYDKKKVSNGKTIERSMRPVASCNLLDRFSNCDDWNFYTEQNRKVKIHSGLFKKVTGLGVEDFNMLCSLGVFNAPLMNDAIFKFKRYEDASLTYTGIDKHTNDEVGGWDTTIRKTQYEKLFYNQQSSMSEIDYSSYSRVTEPIETTHRVAKPLDGKTIVKISQAKSTVQERPVKPTAVDAPLQEPQTIHDLEVKLESIGVDSTVVHKKFGKGTVVKINKNEKFIHIKFTLGEKKFIFPDAFLMGFLEME